MNGVNRWAAGSFSRPARKPNDHLEVCLNRKEVRLANGGIRIVYVEKCFKQYKEG
jgi:hypothetical protein